MWWTWTGEPWSTSPSPPPSPTRKKGICEGFSDQTFLDKTPTKSVSLLTWSSVVNTKSLGIPPPTSAVPGTSVLCFLGLGGLGFCLFLIPFLGVSSSTAFLAADDEGTLEGFLLKEGQ